MKQETSVRLRQVLAVSNWLLAAQDEEECTKYKSDYSQLNAYKNEIQAILDPVEDFNENSDGTFTVSDRAMTDVFYAYINKQLVFGSR